jgi:short-subunit dehydrogenase
MGTMAIFGAGPALGMATARRFGREGFRVALVARNRERLDGMVRELAGEGVGAARFPADLTDRTTALAALDAIEARFGSIDVLEYSPAAPAGGFRAASQVDVATVAAVLDPALLTPVALVGRVLPAMLARGDGGLLFALGASAGFPVPRLASAGLVLAALRSYAHALHAEVGPRGVYAGTLLIGALIAGSASHRDAGRWNGGGRELAVVGAGELADRLWDLYTRRDRSEEVVAPGFTGVVRGGCGYDYSHMDS